MQVVPIGADVNVSATHFDYSVTEPPIELDGGRFLALWSRYDWGAMPVGFGYVMTEIYGRLYESDGSPVGPEFRINEEQLSSQAEAFATPLDDGGFLVAFQTYAENGSFLGRFGIAVRRFDANEVAQTEDILTIYNPSASVSKPVLTRLDSGAILMTWLEDQPHPGNDVLKGAFLDASGGTTGTPFDIATTGSGGTSEHAAVVLDNGNIMVAYTGQDADGAGTFVKVYTPTGTALGTPVQLNTAVTGFEGSPVAAKLADGSVMVVWKDAKDYPSSDMNDLYGRRVAADGMPLSDLMLLTDDYAWDQNVPDIIALADGGFMIAFSSGYVDYQVFLRRFSADGTPIDTETFISSDPNTGDTFRPVLLELADGRMVAFWLDMVTSSSSQVMMWLFEAQWFGTPASDALTGTDGDDWIDAMTGNDTAHGGAGNDSMIGHDGADALYGESGDDTLEGGNGLDTLCGGDGNDSLSGDVAADTLHGGNGRDTIDGGIANDVIFGDDGNDTLFGGSGNDTINGGAQNDYVSGQNGYDQIVGGNGNDTLLGGGGHDFITGGQGADELRGGDHNDTLIGSICNDTLFGGAGNDSLLAGDSNDTVYGNQGADTLDGGAGADMLFGGFDDDTFRFANAVQIGGSGGLPSDVIMDFQQGLDVIDLSPIDALTTVAGNQAFTFVGTAAHSGAGARCVTPRTGRTPLSMAIFTLTARANSGCALRVSTF